MESKGLMTKMCVYISIKHPTDGLASTQGCSPLLTGAAAAAGAGAGDKGRTAGWPWRIISIQF